MTKEEFSALEAHDKIRFIGDPSRDIYQEEYFGNHKGNQIIKPLIKGKIYTINSIYSHMTSGIFCLYGVSGIPHKKFIGQKKRFPFKISYVPNNIENDWELVETRHHIVKTQWRSKLGINGVKRTIRNLKSRVESILFYYKRTLDNYLQDITIDQKILLLFSFKGEEKKILELLFEYKDFSTFINHWDGAHRDEDDNSKQ